MPRLHCRALDYFLAQGYNLRYYGSQQYSAQRQNEHFYQPRHGGYST